MSSIRAADFDLSATQAPGVLALYYYLDYADRGPEALGLRHPGSWADFESPLERDVAGVIRALGYDVVPQVGCSGFRVDLGVVDPTEPGRFLLGVECDGAIYHSAYTARDRDRLRQEVLENLGWRIHRVWAPDWVTRRETEESRLRQAIEHAQASIGSVGSTPSREEPLRLEDLVVKRSEPPTLDDSETFVSWTVPYRVCKPETTPPAGVDFHDPAANQTLAFMLKEVIDVEAPVHIDLAASRLARRWGLQKVGGRMMNAINAAISGLVRKGTAVRRGKFLWPRRNDFALQVRRPDPSDEDTIRKIDFIPPEELELAIRQLIRDAISISENYVLTQVARVFGFDRTGINIRRRLERILHQMIQRGVLVRNGDRVSLNQDDPT